MLFRLMFKNNTVRFILTYILLVLSFDLYVAFSKSKGGCRFSLKKDIPKPTPIILSATESKILYPDADGFLRLRKNEQFRLLCTGNEFRDKYLSSSSSSSSSSSLSVTCRKGRTVKFGNRLIQLRKLPCREYPKSAVKQVGIGCYDNRVTSVLIEIGFHVPIVPSLWRSIKNYFFADNDDKNDFVTQYRVCFDNVTKNNLYSMYDRSNLADSDYQVNKKRGSFRRDYYPSDISESYHWRNEQRILSEILNSTELASTYVKGDRKRYLSRGHLTPRADFVYGFEQTATMYYVNVAPQWQQFNAGNWELLESAVRKYLDGRDGSDYKIVSGIYEQATLPDADGRPKGLFLYKNQENNIDNNNNSTNYSNSSDDNNNNNNKVNPMITVPKYYWKIIYRKTTGTGFAFVGINNPYLDLDEIIENYRICRDICYTLDWITFDIRSIEKGYIMCCDMRELLDYLRMPDLFVER